MSEAQPYQAGNIDRDRVVYLASDFDNVTRLFLDAAERCIASERREKELQQRLTAADERADVLEAWCRKIMNSSETMLSTAHEEELFGLVDPADANGYDQDDQQ